MQAGPYISTTNDYVFTAKMQGVYTLTSGSTYTLRTWKSAAGGTPIYWDSTLVNISVYTQLAQ